MDVLFTAWMSGDTRRAEILLAEPSPSTLVIDEDYVNRMYASLNLPLEETSKDWCNPPSLSTPTPLLPQVAHSRYSNYVRFGNWCVRPDDVRQFIICDLATFVADSGCTGK
jgi:hypothetical protein